MTAMILDYNSIDRALLQQIQIKMTEKVKKSKKKYNRKNKKWKNELSKSVHNQ